MHTIMVLKKEFHLNYIDVMQPWKYNNQRNQSVRIWLLCNIMNEVAVNCFRSIYSGEVNVKKIGRSPTEVLF